MLDFILQVFSFSVNLFANHVDFYHFLCYIIRMNTLQFTIKNMKHNAIEQPPFCLPRPYGLKEYLLLLFKSSGQMVIHTKTYVYKPNMFILLSPKTVHEINTLDNALVHDYIHFTVNDDALLQKKVQCNKLRFHSQAAWFSELIKILFQEYLYSSASDHLTNALMSTILLYSQANRIPKNAYTRHELQLKKHFDDIRNSFYTNHFFPQNIKEFANALFLSESCFSHLYKKFYNISPAKDIVKMQLQYAKELLELTDLAIADISEKCGFSSVVIFIRTFKKNFNVSPGKWR